MQSCTYTMMKSREFGLLLFNDLYTNELFLAHVCPRCNTWLKKRRRSLTAIVLKFYDN